MTDIGKNLVKLLTEDETCPRTREAMRRVMQAEERLTVLLTVEQQEPFEEVQEAAVALAASEEEEMCVKAFLPGVRTV